jgi:hypothetical protein
VRSLTLKLVLAFLAVSLVGTILLALLAGRTTASEFNTFVFSQEQSELMAPLADYYRRNGNWSGVEQVLPGGGMGMGPGPRAGHGPARTGTGAVVLVGATGRVIVGGMGYHLGEQLSPRASRWKSTARL